MGSLFGRHEQQQQPMVGLSPAMVEGALTFEPASYELDAKTALRLSQDPFGNLIVAPAAAKSDEPHKTPIMSFIGSVMQWRQQAGLNSNAVDTTLKSHDEKQEANNLSSPEYTQEQIKFVNELSVWLQKGSVPEEALSRLPQGLNNDALIKLFNDRGIVIVPTPSAPKQMTPLAQERQLRLMTTPSQDATLALRLAGAQEGTNPRVREQRRETPHYRSRVPLAIATSIVSALIGWQAMTSARDLTNEIGTEFCDQNGSVCQGATSSRKNVGDWIDDQIASLEEKNNE